MAKRGKRGVTYLVLKAIDEDDGDDLAWRCPILFSVCLLPFLCSLGPLLLSLFLFYFFFLVPLLFVFFLSFSSFFSPLFFFLSPEKVDFLGHQQSRHNWTVGDRFWSELQLRVEGDLIGLGIVEDWTVYIFPGLSWHLPGSISFFSLQFVSSVSRGRRWQNRKCKTTSFWTEGYSSIFHFKYQRLFNLVPEI